MICRKYEISSQLYLVQWLYAREVSRRATCHSYFLKLFFLSETLNPAYSKLGMFKKIDRMKSMTRFTFCSIWAPLIFGFMIWVSPWQRCLDNIGSTAEVTEPVASTSIFFYPVLHGLKHVLIRSAMTPTKWYTSAFSCRYVLWFCFA